MKTSRSKTCCMEVIFSVVFLMMANTAYSQNYAGTWSGTTSQGKSISFTVEGSTVTRIELTLTVGGCTGTKTITCPNCASIVNDKFHVGYSDITMDVTFDTNSSCHGTWWSKYSNCGSASGTFTASIDCTPLPGTPSNPSPPDGATEVSTSTDLDWNDVADADSYDVYFGTSPTPPLVGNVTVSSYDPGTLANDNHYFWKVVAKNGCGDTVGPEWDFATICSLPPAVPSNPSPADGADEIPDDTILDWDDTSDADSYDVYFGTSTPPPYVGNTTTSDWVLDNLNPNNTYYWQIIAKNSCGETGGPVWNFTTILETLETKLSAIDGAYNDRFGNSVSISGDWAIVGAYRDDDNGTDSGSAYIFNYDGTTWSQHSKLTASEELVSDRFGNSVSISGDWAIVGVIEDDDYVFCPGSAYIFHYDGTTWSQHSKLTASNGTIWDYFGGSVSISGDWAIVGADDDDDNGRYDSGSAYIFHYDGTTWSQHSKLTASDGANYDHFGVSVSISGDRVIVGAYEDDDYGSGSGSAYIFHYDGTTWSQHRKLTASDGAGSDYFGRRVSISGDQAIVGAYRDDDNGTDSGSAYIFHYDGTTWSQHSKLTASDGAGSDYFGVSVSISGDLAIVGATYDDDNGSRSGSAYIFNYDGTTWSQHSKRTASDGANYDYFGGSVSISGDRTIVGATYDDDNGTDSGSAYIFYIQGDIGCPDANCDDGNICTTDICNRETHSCEYTLTNEGGTCNDSLFCTENDVCSGGTCSGQTKSCDDGVGCTDDSCDEANDQCVNTANNDNCGDSVGCTDDICDPVNDCQYTANNNNCDDGNVCTDDVCDSVNDCQYTSNTASCDDGFFCTENDVCSGGTCGGQAKSCDDSVSCTDDSCDEAYDQCVSTADDSACNDGDSCTDDSCDSLSGCEYYPIDNCSSSISMNLDSDWNLISLSVEPADTAIATVLDSISGKYVSVWAFINGGWKVYDPDNPGFSDLTSMEAGWGYWLNMSESATLNVSGFAPSDSIDLVSGWNLVGCNTSTSPAIADALTSFLGKYVSVWAYIDGAWQVYDPQNPGFSDLITMEPNFGYWINTTEACTWCDESALETFYRDGDKDGYGDPTVIIEACSATEEYVSDNTDCDDTNEAINPDTVWYKDADGDQYSDGSTKTQCTQPTNYYLASDMVATSGDCDDTDSAFHENCPIINYAGTWSGTTSQGHPISFTIEGSTVTRIELTLTAPGCTGTKTITCPSCATIVNDEFHVNYSDITMDVTFDTNSSCHGTWWSKYSNCGSASGTFSATK